MISEFDDVGFGVGLIAATEYGTDDSKKNKSYEADANDKENFGMKNTA